MRRQYSLPSCTLTIEGLGDESSFQPQTPDNRPLISTLMEVECQFTGVDPTLKGGKAFFDNLLREINHYTQGFLSGIHHPSDSHDQQVKITCEFLCEQNLHRLTVQSSKIATEKIVLDLNTVQLFDLVEILDQLLADPQTLPDLVFELKPLSRRYRIAEQSLGRQAAPAALGLSSLAVAGLAFFFLLPVPPEVKKPEGVTKNNTPEEVAQNNKENEPKESISPEEAQSILSQAVEIDEPTELDFIKRHLFKTINTVWRDREQIQGNLSFMVTTTKDGSIIDYQSLEGTPEDAVEQTPLKDLRYLPTQEGQINKEEIAKFKVVFNNSILEINPLNGYQRKPGFGPEITNKNQLKRMTVKLKELLTENFKENQRFSATLEFRIGMTENGEIGDYEALNQKAINYEDETPLPKLINLEAAGIKPGGSLVPQTPLGQFQVVFYPNGKIEVSPWRGY